jgi:hypothetical protein
MERLEEIAGVLQAIDPNQAGVDALREEATSALTELDEPWVGARQLFDSGQVAAALKRARGCDEYADCDVLVEPLSKLAAAWPKLKSTNLERLVELYELARRVSLTQDGKPVTQLGELLTARLGTAAHKCRAAGDWVCVDRHLATAERLDLGFSDGSYERGLNSYAKETFFKAYALRKSDPQGAESLMARMRQLTTVDTRLQESIRRFAPPADP